LAVVGSGGKTGTIFSLARQFDGPVIVTTSTHLGLSQVRPGDRHIALQPGEVVTADEIAGQGVTLLTGPALASEPRLSGLSEAQLAQVAVLADQIGCPVLVEADGSRQKPLKAPADHEPAIPGWVNAVLVVAGLSGLGQPLDAGAAHRPERFSAVSGLALGETVTEAAVAAALTHPLGGRKGIAPRMRPLVLLNQADGEVAQAAARRLEPALLGHFERVLTGAVRDRPPENQIMRVAKRVAGIILAAGASERYGQPKQLLLYRGQPFIRVVAQTALAAGLSPLIVVVGAVDAPIRAALEGLPVQIVFNPRWPEGQSTSMRVALEAIPESAGGGIFFLSDQPQLPVGLVTALLDRHAETLAPVVMPFAGGRRGNPVLFDRAVFPDLASVTGDRGGRALFDRYPIERVEWPDESILLDVDTPDDYHRLIGNH
jgi:molybdenum cofactor cytidylyltransferase